MKRKMLRSFAVLTAGVGLVVCAAANYPEQDPARVAAIAARLPERPGTPAPRPSDRAAWAFLANDPDIFLRTGLSAAGDAAARAAHDFDKVIGRFPF